MEQHWCLSLDCRILNVFGTSQKHSWCRILQIAEDESWVGIEKQLRIWAYRFPPWRTVLQDLIIDMHNIVLLVSNGLRTVLSKHVCYFSGLSADWNWRRQVSPIAKDLGLWNYTLDTRFESWLLNPHREFLQFVRASKRMASSYKARKELVYFCSSLSCVETVKVEQQRYVIWWLCSHSYFTR